MINLLLDTPLTIAMDTIYNHDNDNIIPRLVKMAQMHIVHTFKMPMNEFEEARSSHSFQSLAAIARQADNRKAATSARDGSHGASQSRASSTTHFSAGAASPSSSSVVNPPSSLQQPQQHIPLSTLKINQSASNSQNISSSTTANSAVPIEIEA